jgi:hypothetical protein
MPIEVMTKDDLQAFRFQLLRDIKQLLDGKPIPLHPDGLLKSTEVMQLLKISKGTLQMLRNNGKLRYTRIGHSCYYVREHIDQLIIK